MLAARNHQPSTLVRVLPAPARSFANPPAIARTEARRDAKLRREDPWNAVLSKFGSACDPEPRTRRILKRNSAELKQFLYLFARQVEWEQHADASAAWEVISAARSSDANLRAHARALLERFQRTATQSPEDILANRTYRQTSTTEAGMRTPYGLEILESCMGCKASREGFFCRLPKTVLRSLDLVSHHNVMPAEALLFVEGQTPRGIFILCSGKVTLSTTSKEGKVLILKQAGPGEVLGLSAVISATNYEMTAETATPCQLNFIGRQDFMALLQRESDVGLHSAVWLSREFQGAYRDIHDLVLARSSSGKLARLLLSCAPLGVQHAEELHLRSSMTHEEMAQRIGSSRETVTRLLSELKKKRLIRLEGATLVIRDRPALEALAV